MQRNEPFLSEDLHPREGNPLKHSLMKGEITAENVPEDVCYPRESFKAIFEK